MADRVHIEAGEKKLLMGAFVVVLLLCNILLCPVIANSKGSNGGGESSEEEFTEELLVKPLPDRKVLTHFHFENSAPPSTANGHHHKLFPKAVAQLVNKFRIQELELSFTQGRWNYEKWGGLDFISTANAKPPGVELWAIFDLPSYQIDATWQNLTHALSGLFCSSINFLELPTAFSTPKWSFKGPSVNLRYGALPREAVCTENLTPWLKLLPCRDKAGIASLLDRPSIYKSYYHSQRLNLRSTKLNGIVLEQTLTVVLQPESKKLFQPNWSISSVFKKGITGKCTLSKLGKMFFEVDKGLPAASFDLSVSPDKTIREADSVFFEYDVSRYSETNPLDVGVTWKHAVDWSTPQAPFHANRFLMGSGNERGSIAISLRSTHKYEESDVSCMNQVVIFQMVPWYVRVYYHTLKILVNGHSQNVSNVVSKILVSPSEDKLAPGILEIMLRVPCAAQSAVLSMDFDKGFLHIDEYPPDANQGFDIPAAIISFPGLHAKKSILEWTGDKSPLLSKSQERKIVQSYTEVLLVPLTTPDFSMPYNVITFTCTVLALYFGSLLNVMRRRVAEEDRLSAKAAGTQGLIPKLVSKISSKILGKKSESMQSESSPSGGYGALFKVAAVALLGIFWHYYLSDGLK